VTKRVLLRNQWFSSLVILRALSNSRQFAEIWAECACVPALKNTKRRKNEGNAVGHQAAKAQCMNTHLNTFQQFLEDLSCALTN